jgi:hypothetical protein
VDAGTVSEMDAKTIFFASLEIGEGGHFFFFFFFYYY